jgi:3-oxoacyl-ACP reductase-like protein
MSASFHLFPKTGCYIKNILKLVFEKHLIIKIMDLKIKNKIALVTGSTAGIGYAIAKALANEGAQVIVNGRTN